MNGFTLAGRDRRSSRTLRILGEVLSQLLNVPILSGALIIFVFTQLHTDIPNRIKGFTFALIFISLVPLSSLLFYIPGSLWEWSRIVKRQRIASFAFMILSFPVGFLILRLTQAPRIYQALALNYTLITMGLVVFNFILRHKASGHAAGVAGPVAAMLYLFGLVAAPLATLIPLTIFARIAAKGHSFWQLITGSLLSITVTILVLMHYGFNSLGPLQ